MASTKVSVLKFVGTVSVGLLTGTSFALSTLAIPSLLELSSASAAAKAFRSLASTATTRLVALSGVSTSAFLLAFVLSPRGYRHPYLLYASLLSLGSSLTDLVAPSIFGEPSSSSSSGASSAAAKRRAVLAQARREKAAARRMVASYDVLDDAHVEEGSSVASGEDVLDDEVNGEEVRGEVQSFVRNQLVQTAVAGIGFMVAVLGVWGDGAHQVADTVIFTV